MRAAPSCDGRSHEEEDVEEGQRFNMYHTDKPLLWLHDVQASRSRTSARHDEQRIVKAAGAEK